jgi:hypothetical protein
VAGVQMNQTRLSVLTCCGGIIRPWTPVNWNNAKGRVAHFKMAPNRIAKTG